MTGRGRKGVFERAAASRPSGPPARSAPFGGSALCLSAPSTVSGVGLLWAVLAVALGGCGEASSRGDATSGTRGEVFDLSAEVEPWVAHEVGRIGAVDDPDQNLSRVGGLAPGPGGTLLVSQPAELVVRMFDEDGALVGTVGGAGDGPGEFRSITALASMGDSFYVMDFLRSRTTFFQADGTPTRTVTVTSPAVGEHFRPTPPYLFLPDGTAVVSPARTSNEMDRFPYLRIDQEGNVLDTLAWQSVDGQRVRLSSSRGITFLSHPFPGLSVAMVLGALRQTVVVEASVAQAEDDAVFRVSWIGFSGDTVRSRRFRYPPVPLGPETADSAVAGLVESSAVENLFAGAGGPAAAERAVREAVRIPAYLPPVTRVLVDEDGTLWLAREDTGGATRRWLVLSPDGEPRGRLDLPAGLVVRLVRGDRMWGVATGPLDVPMVVEYRVGPRTAGNE